ncbi:hypothetical protein K449DRAFT_224864 [Hypoxylon sp. EC38]|nr:hypothetical protein K449DRAFT_224864 [Hypoxylon sp. EC38]
MTYHGLAPLTCALTGHTHTSSSSGDLTPELLTFYPGYRANSSYTTYYFRTNWRSAATVEATTETSTLDAVSVGHSRTAVTGRAHISVPGYGQSPISPAYSLTVTHSVRTLLTDVNHHRRK